LLADFRIIKNKSLYLYHTVNKFVVAIAISVGLT
jgi:hypothetical protein